MNTLAVSNPTYKSTSLVVSQNRRALARALHFSVASDAHAKMGNVLKITITETPTELRWVLQGRLFGPWVTALGTNWRSVSRSRNGRACHVDLNDVTFIDKSGENLLRAMSREGAQFTAKGLYIKNVLEGLK
jgi:hypothetical protein